MALNSRICVIAILLGISSPLAAATQSVTIPRVDAAPRLSDVTDAERIPTTMRQMATIEGLVQRTPSDGAPVSEKTTVLVGYDDRNMYAVFLCTGSSAAVRAHRVNRDRLPGDNDSIALHLDTFRDGRKLYGFQVNAVGAQADGIYTEGQGWDLSFDAVWHATTAILSNGYVVVVTIPFRSLRFPARDEHRWGLFVYRGIPHKHEEAFWPAYSVRYQGRLAYAAELRGLQGVRAGRSTEVTPYTTMRGESISAARSTSRVQGRAGVDVKITPRQNLVLDLAANPDFSQVESDEPQTTVNQRFEVLFPEKRPFFIENASYFQTPLQVIFTRRIREPQVGTRFSGKVGKYAVGTMFADDVGGRGAEGRAFTTVFRVSRDLAPDSQIGMLYASRADGLSANQVAGADGRWHLGRHVVTTAQFVGSRLERDGSGAETGTAHRAGLDAATRLVTSSVAFSAIAPNVHAAMGFVPRTDVRELTASTAITFRPTGSSVLAWGPSVSVRRLWSYGGEPLDASARAELGFQLPQQTRLAVFHHADVNRLRPGDILELDTTRCYEFGSTGLTASSAPLSGVGFTFEFASGGSGRLSPNSPGE
jgi:hypothetical protein